MRGGEVIKKARKLRGFPQVFVAEHYGLSLNTIKNYESGRTEPPFNSVIEILEMLGIDYSEVASNDEC